MPETDRIARPAGRGARPLDTRREDQQDLQVREHHLAVGQVSLAIFTPEPVDQVADLPCRVAAQGDRGISERIIEQRSAATDLGVEGLDAEKIGVKQDAIPAHRPLRIEPDVLVGNEEEERVRNERQPRRVRPEVSMACPDPVDREAVRPKRFVRTVELDRLDADRLAPRPGVIPCVALFCPFGRHVVSSRTSRGEASSGGRSCDALSQRRIAHRK